MGANVMAAAAIPAIPTTSRLWLTRLRSRGWSMWTYPRLMLVPTPDPCGPRHRNRESDPENDQSAPENGDFQKFPDRDIAATEGVPTKVPGRTRRKADGRKWDMPAKGQQKDM